MEDVNVLLPSPMGFGCHCGWVDFGVSAAPVLSHAFRL